MSSVAEQLEKRYGIEIEFADQNIASRRVRSKATPQESIDNILNALSYIENFKYKIADNKHYTIY